MTTEDITILQTSDDPEAVFEAALNISHSNDPKGLQALDKKIASEDFLALIDSAEDYQYAPDTLNITGILESLAGNDTPEAREILVHLTGNTTFLTMLSRVEMLILACGEIRPAPEPVLTFWAEQAGPESSSTPLVIEALFINGTEPAMKLFENMMSNPRYADSDKIFWLRTYAVPHRDDLFFLEAFARNMPENAEDQSGLEWLRVIFDYSAGWYPPQQNLPTPPDPLQITPQAKETLLKIADQALAIQQLPPALKTAIKTRLMLYSKKDE